MGAFAALGPQLASAQTSLTLINYDPGQEWTVNSSDGVNTATQNVIAAMQTHNLVPAINAHSTFELFCVEVGQQTAPVGVTQPNYFLVALAQADTGIPSSQTMETYAGISASGIGAAAAERISKLYAHVFGLNYTPSVTLINDTLIAAFQLAVWEVSHDNDFSLSHPGAGVQGFYVSGSGPAIYANAVNQANAWLFDLQSNYGVIVGMELAVLHHDTKQDLIIPIPEPSAYAAFAGVAALVLTVRRRLFSIS